MTYDCLEFACHLFSGHQQKCQGLSVRFNISLILYLACSVILGDTIQGKLMVFVWVSKELSVVTHLAKPKERHSR